ncbi:hypothetical protein VP01_3647g5 [Puccinia sorghi]|uniref:Cyclopropane-fatty-acyl-phospholipid synthase n=1 Tax=Puccinia sorghi TaxID=27349 RepID=A0A0L6UUJ9_9BASI|nr:hypothetical protein VP01_3647g5 [Puccinia sorghi]
MSMLTSTLFTTLNKLINSRFANTISNTLQNISAHYDISNEMFEAFLSKDMTYSCAYFPPSLGGPDGDLIKSLPSDQQEKEDPIKKRKKQQDVLELAQYAKIDLIIEKAKIRRGDRVLEIGTGWGSFAIRAVSRTGCSVETVTLSQEQKRLAEARITAAGLSDKIRVHLLDYRHLPTHFKGTTFHRIVSIEMIEAVGIEFLNTFFHVIHQCLHPSIGIAVFQVITIPEARFQRYLKINRFLSRQVDFIRKWIFPGGVLPTVTLITSGITEGSRGQLLIDSVQNIGPRTSFPSLQKQNRRGGIGC